MSWMRSWFLAATSAALALAACATPRAPVGGAPIGPSEPRSAPATPRAPSAAGHAPPGGTRPGAPPVPAEPAAPPAATRTGEPAYLAPGWTRPRERSEGCVERAVTAPAGLWGTADPITLKFAVRPDGRVDSFQCITSIEDGQAPRGSARRFVRQLEEAVLGCAFEPGRDPAGRPAAMWRFLSVRPAPAAPGGP